MCPLCLTQISWVAVIVAAVVSFFVGMLWYSPILFADRWARAANFTFDKNMNIAPCLIGAFIIALAQSYGIAWFLEHTQSFTLMSAYTVVSLLAVIFIGTQLVSLWLWERRPFELMVLNVGCALVQFVAMATVLVLFA